jgi:cytochrome c oxidase assembly protein subunit 15
MTDRAQSPRLATVWFAVLTAVTWTLIFFGAAVRANGAGLACPDWPLCFGQWVPVFDFGVLLEWGHRTLAGAISVGLVIGLLLAWRHPETRRATWTLGWITLLVLGCQVVLGGLTVLLLLASWTVTAHLLLGNALAAAFLLITLRLWSVSRQPTSQPLGTAPRLLSGSVGGLLVVQLIIGGLVSSNYAGLACADWPTCQGSAWFPAFSGLVGLQIWHRLVAYGLVAAWLAFAFAVRNDAALRRLGFAGAVLVLAQAALGIANVLLALPVEVTVAHSAGAAALVLLTTATVRAVSSRPAAPASPSFFIAKAVQ